MNQEKIGELIKEIRKQNNLTQKQFADKYNVTYQAVSKWENGINMPDITLIQKISKDFNISLDDILEGKINKKNKKNEKLILISIIVLVTILLTSIFFVKSTSENFEFKKLASTNEDFDVSGIISYNKNKSSIYISNIKYNGQKTTTTYNEIECNLYEKNNDIEKKISSYKYQEKELIKLEEFLEQVTLTVDDYEKLCKDYTEDSLYILISANNDNKSTTTHKIPLVLEDSCSS